MFTGLVEAVQNVRKIADHSGGRMLSIPLGDLSTDTKPGDSICVQGVCLTVSRMHGELAEFDVMPETLRCSTLGDLRRNDRVHLERAMPATGRFGGHMVQGHIDGVGTIDQIIQNSQGHVLWIEAGADLMDLMIPKGSVAIDGVSLTIVSVEPSRFSVHLIPTTLRETAFPWRKKRDRVNLEADLISKWIKKRLDQMLSKGNISRLSLEKLRDQGFA